MTQIKILHFQGRLKKMKLLLSFGIQNALILETHNVVILRLKAGTGDTDKPLARQLLVDLMVFETIALGVFLEDHWYV
jgi:hypothetical protein